MAYANYCFICGLYRDGHGDICPKCTSPYIIYSGKLPQVEVYLATSKRGRDAERMATLYTCRICNEIIDSDGTCSCSKKLDREYQRKQRELAQKEAEVIREATMVSERQRQERYHRYQRDVLTGANVQKCESCGAVITLGLCNCNRM